MLKLGLPARAASITAVATTTCLSVAVVTLSSGLLRRGFPLVIIITGVRVCIVGRCAGGSAGRLPVSSATVVFLCLGGLVVVAIDVSILVSSHVAVVPGNGVACLGI